MGILSDGNLFPEALVQWQSAQEWTELQIPASLSFPMSCFIFKPRVWRQRDISDNTQFKDYPKGYFSYSFQEEACRVVHVIDSHVIQGKLNCSLCYWVKYHVRHSSSWQWCSQLRQPDTCPLLDHFNFFLFPDLPDTTLKHAKT